MRGEGGNLKPEFWREMSVEMKEDRSGGKRKDCMTAETNSARETGPSSHTLDPVVRLHRALRGTDITMMDHLDETTSVTIGPLDLGTAMELNDALKAIRKKKPNG